MDKCKYCQQELAEDSTVCPHCGKDNAEETVKAPISETEAQEAVSDETPVTEQKPEQEAEKPEQETEKPEQEAEKPEQETEKPEQKAEEPAKEEKKKATPGQMALGVVAIVVLAAVLIALILAAIKPKGIPSETAEPTAAPAVTQPVPAETVIPTVPADGDDPAVATFKGSYSAEEEDLKAAAKEVVATMAEFELTNSELQVYYWEGIRAFMSSNPYAAYMLDLSMPLDVQPCIVAEGMTWQQFFLANAFANWQNYQAMAAEADAHKVPADPEVTKFISELPAELKKLAEENGYADAEALIAADMGPGTNLQDYVHFRDVFHRGYGYYEYFLEQSEPTDEQVEAYFQEHKEALEEGGVNKDAKSVNVRHILVTPEDVENEESWKEAEQKAKDLLDEFLAGDKKEETFAAMATEHTQDPGSKATGGLYENVMLGQMVPEFEGWCFDDNRKVADTGIVKTDYGYHVMFYSGDQTIWQERVRQMYLSEKTEELMKKNTETYPMHVDYSKVLLGQPVPQG